MTPTNCPAVGVIYPRFLQAVFNGAFRKVGIMPFAGKSFFLRGGDYFSITDQARGGVVVKSGYA